jgi:hypothetical protein
MLFTSFPATGVLGKRTRSVGDSQLVRTTPSQMGKLREYRSLQLNPPAATKLLDDRPRQDSVPPASLLYDGFGHFMDDFRHREDAYDMGTERWELESAVNDFAEEMTVIYNNDDDRMRECLRALDEIFSLDSHNELMATDIDCGAYYDGPHGAVSCIAVIKNELVDINSIPVVELTSHVARLHDQSMMRLEDPYGGWRVPYLGLTVVGKLISLILWVVFILM